MQSKDLQSVLRQQARDKVDEVFDLDEDIGRTAAQELEADFNEGSKCFSFSNTGKLKDDLQKHSSMISKISRKSLVLPETDFDESLNMRSSNQALSQSGDKEKTPQLFKAGSINDSEKDKKSGHFLTSPAQIPGSAEQNKNIKNTPNYRSPNQKVIHQKLDQKDIKPSFIPVYKELLEDEIPSPAKNRVSLNESNIEIEGKIGPTDTITPIKAVKKEQRSPFDQSDDKLFIRNRLLTESSGTKEWVSADNLQRKIRIPKSKLNTAQKVQSQSPFNASGITKKFIKVKQQAPNYNITHQYITNLTVNNITNAYKAGKKLKFKRVNNNSSFDKEQIKQFTQGAEINESRKRVNTQPVSKQNSAQHLVIGKFRDLLQIFGVDNYNEVEQSFIYQGNSYKLDIQELLQDHNHFRIKTQRSKLIVDDSSSEYAFNNQMQQYSNINVQSQLERFKNKTPREELQGIGNGPINPLNPNQNTSSGSRLLGVQRMSKSPTLLQNESMSLRPPSVNNDNHRKLDLKRAQNESALLSAPLDKSQRSGQSGQHSAISSQNLVKYHEQFVRKKSQERKKSKPGFQQISRSGTSQGVQGLGLQRQNVTDQQSLQSHLVESNIGKVKNQSQQQLHKQEKFLQTQNLFPKKHIQFASSSGNTSSLQIQPWMTNQSTTKIHEDRDEYINPSRLNLQQYNTTACYHETQDDDINAREDLIMKRQQIHLAFLFASPLMLKTSENEFKDGLTPISFQEEFEQIIDMIGQKNIEFNYRYTVATKKNLKNALKENPVGLHFSGHGFMNTKELYRGDTKGHMKYKERGDVLIFEAENGASDFFFTSDLQKMFEEIKKSQQIDECDAEGSPTQLQFVYVASCHSEMVGNIFLEAGVPHVICIDQKYTVKDKAAIEFTKHFYDEIFDIESHRSVCEAFSIAQSKVSEQDKAQAQRFLLLKNEKYHGEICSGKDDVRLNPKFGEAFQVGISHEYMILPNKVTPFLSRNNDMFETLRMISDNNIVQIWGMPGFGCSSILKNVSCFLGERDIYRDGIIYIDLVRAQTFKEAMDLISFYLEESKQMNHFYQSFNQDEETDKSQRIKMLITNFISHKFLFSFDNVDHLHKDNHKKFIEFLKQIVGNQKVKILFKSYKYLYDEMCDGFIVKKISNLKKMDAVDLFMNKIPMGKIDKDAFFEWENIEELHQKTLDKYGGEKGFVEPKICKQRHPHSLQTCVRPYLAKHPIFEFLGGAPMVINIVAPMCVMKSLTEIFLYLAEKNQASFSDKLNQLMYSDSLINSLEYCTQYFQNGKKKILELWYMIGVQGPGILHEDLLQIHKEGYGKMSLTTDGKFVTAEDQLNSHLEELQQFSLIEKENLDKAGTKIKYRVTPFIDQYINVKMNVHMKKDSINTVCIHLTSKLIEFKEEYAQKVVKTDEDIGKLVEDITDKICQYEDQIKFLVAQMFKFENKKDRDEIMNDSFGEDSSCEDDDTIMGPKRLNTTDHQSLRTTQKSNTKSSHQRKKSRDVPMVSDQIKYSRSTFVEKDPKKNTKLQQMLKAGQEFQSNEEQKQRSTTLMSKNSQRSRSRQGAQHNNTLDNYGLTMNSSQKQQVTNLNLSLLGAGLNQPSLQKRKFSEEQQSQELQYVDNNMQRSKSKNKMTTFYERKKTPNLGFVDAKESFKRDREQAFQSEEDSVEAKEEKRNTFLQDMQKSFRGSHQSDERSDLSPYEQKEDLLAVPKDPAREALAIQSQRSSDANPFEKNINYSEIFHQLNPNSAAEDIFSEDPDIPYAQIIVNDPKKLKRRQTIMLNQLKPVNYDHEDPQGNLQILRNSHLDKSKSKNLKDLTKNPDIQNALQPIPEEVIYVNNSAPVKSGSQESASECTHSKKKHECLELKPHEELFFHYLSILALIPDRRSSISQILDTFGQKDLVNSFKSNKDGNDFIEAAEKRIKKFKTDLQIPDDSKLMIANTMMIELYVAIYSGDDIINKRKGREKFNDKVYETAHQTREFYEDLQFKRGLGILDYIQATRIFATQMRWDEFKDQMLQSADWFLQTHEVDGIRQCIVYSEKALQKKIKLEQQLTKKQSFEDDDLIDKLKELLSTLENNEDEQIQGFIDFRQSIIKNLSSVKKQGQEEIKVDLIHNMLLNPQLHHSKEI